jgi:hypothetical protein
MRLFVSVVVWRCTHLSSRFTVHEAVPSRQHGVISNRTCYIKNALDLIILISGYIINLKSNLDLLYIY